MTVTSNAKWGIKRRREYDLGQNAVLDGETQYNKNVASVLYKSALYNTYRSKAFSMHKMSSNHFIQHQSSSDSFSNLKKKEKRRGAGGER